MTATQAIYNLSSIIFGLAALANLITTIRAMRALRWHRAAMEVIFAYEKELVERGVNLPPRCFWCKQVLPKHVEGCEVASMYHGKMLERLTRPPIKYYPDGSQPPDLKGNGHA